MSAFGRLLSALFLVAMSSSEAFTTTTTTMPRPLSATALAASKNVVDDSRRSMFKNAGALAAMVAFTPVVAANALDMDAFANAQVRNSTSRAKKNTRV